jgi:hypothetical protein
MPVGPAAPILDIQGPPDPRRPGDAMRNSQFLTVGLALLAGYVLAMALNRPIAGQAPSLDPLPTRPSGATWRFHMTVVNNGQAYPLLIVTDTTSGHCWVRESGPQEEEEWRDLGSPEAARK